MPHTMVRSWSLGLAFSTALAAAALIGAPAAAQEDNISPPAPLQFPTLPSAAPKKELPVSNVRDIAEFTGNTELCKFLTKEAHPDVVFPPGFNFTQCDPAIAAQVRAGTGSVHWASGARPRECGLDCIGRPLNDHTRALDQPNRRFAVLRGRLTFTVVNAGPTPFDRDVFFPFEVRVACRVESGQRTGEVHVTTVAEQPFADEPGFFESLGDFFLGPLNISRGIESGIRAALGGGAISDQGMGPCSSIGGEQNPQDFRGDRFVWDEPAPPLVPPGTHPEGGALGTTATVVFESIVRNRTLEREPPTAPQQFVVFVNGTAGVIPRIGTLDLPPGGRHDQRYCKSVNVAGLDALQILVTDGVGGAVWSQFPRRADFGNGPPRKMTTGRTYFEAPMHVEGAPEPPGGDKPQAFSAREFEVQYHVEFQPPVAELPPSGTTGHGPHAGTHGEIGHGGVATRDTEQPPPAPCIKI